MVDVYKEKVPSGAEEIYVVEEIPCICDADKVNPACEHPDCIEYEEAPERWVTLKANLDKAATEIREAVQKGAETAGPVFREKVAPALSEATAKLAELAENASKKTAEAAGVADGKTPAQQIGSGLTAVASGLLGLSHSLAEWISEHAGHAAAEAKFDHKAKGDAVVVDTIEFEGKAPEVDVVPVVEEVKVTPVVEHDVLGKEDVPVIDDVQAVADILQVPVVTASDGDIDVVEPNTY